MPRVPTLQENRIEETLLTPARVSTDSPSRLPGQRSLSRATENLARAAVGIQQEEKKKADQLAIIDADRKLSHLETQLLYDKETGAMNKKGKDAFEVPDQVEEDYRKGVAEIEETLTSDFQKMSFRGLSSKRGVFINRQVQKHVSGEAETYDRRVTESYIANERNAAMENFDNPERIQQAIDNQRGAILSHGDRQGLDSESLKNQVVDMESKTHSAVLTRILNGGADRQGAEYYKQNKKKIVGADKVRMEKMLKQSRLMGEGQRQADKIMAVSGEDSKEALSMARNIKDPKLRDETVSRVKQQLADQRAAERDLEEKSYETAFEAVETYKSMDAIPKDVLDNIPATDQRKLRNHLANLLEGRPTKTDFGVYYELEQMAGAPATRDKFLRLNLKKFTADLSQKDLQKFSALQSKLRNGDDKEANGIETKGSIINSALFAAGMEFGKSASEEENQRANQFKREVDNLVVEQEERTGKKVTNEELRQITDKLMTEVVTGSSYFFFDDKKRFFERSANDTLQVRFEDIPPAAVNQIGNDLRRANLPVTNDNIQKVYVDKLNELDRRGRGGGV